MANPNGRTHFDEHRSFEPTFRPEHDVRDWPLRRDGRDDWRRDERDWPFLAQRRRDDDRFIDRGDRGGQPGGSHYYADRDDRMDSSEGRNRGYGFDDDPAFAYGQSNANPYYGNPSYGGPSYGRMWGPAWHGHGPHFGKGPQGFQRSDERIRELVCEALYDDDFIDATNITVDVRQGEVILAGHVDDRRTKRWAEDVVERIAGVRDIQNQIKVRAHTQQMR